MDILDRLAKVWVVVKWLDDARWSAGASSALIPGPVFTQLSPDAQVLTHWLTYITDQQRTWEDVWSFGSPIVAEVVGEYQRINNREGVLDLLKSVTERNTDPKKVDRFSSTIQTIEGKKLNYTPRFGDHLVAIARTLYHLTGFNNSIATYLSANNAFINKFDSNKDDSMIARIAFLMYLLSYDQVPKGLTSYHLHVDEFKKDLEIHRIKIMQLQNQAELEKLYQVWFVHKRFHKRLWASVRDYVKPGSQFEVIFLQALDQANVTSISNYIRSNRSEILTHLELPGDVWNLRFNERLFDKQITSPLELRNSYSELRKRGGLNDQFYPEQFDIGFDFAPRMCDLQLEALCPFKNSSKLKQYCLGLQARQPEKAKCSITRILCGYETDCILAGCPMYHGSMYNVCSGCKIKVERIAANSVA